VFACLTSYLVLHEHLGSRSLLGAVLILLGIACTELLSAAAPLPTHPA
jgi:drug/metabolite transporter (DMT)-like permease